MKIKSAIMMLVLLVFGIFYVEKSAAQKKQGKVIVRQPLEQLAFPRAEIETGDSLLQIGLATQNSPLIVEGMWKKQQGILAISRDSIVSVMMQLDSVISVCNDPVAQSMLYLIQAKLYSDSKDRFRYVFNPGVNSGNNYLLGMTNEEILKKTIDLIWKSLEPAELLQQTDIQIYKAVLTEGADSRTVRPTVYDFVAHQALSLYMGMQYNIDEYIAQNLIKESDLFCPVTDFLKIKFDDSPYQVIPGMFRIYQNLLRFREKEPHTSPFLIDDLERIGIANQYMNDCYYSDDIRDRYMKILFDMFNAYGDNVYSAEIVKKLYPIVKASDKYDDVKKLYDLCGVALAKFGNKSEQAKIFQNIYKNLSSPELLLAEKMDMVFYPKEKQTVKYKYNNIKDLHISISRIDVSSEIYYGTIGGRESFPRKQVYKKSIHVNDTLTMIPQSLDIVLPGLDFGLYHVELLPDTAQTRKTEYIIHVSALLAQTLRTSATDGQIIITDGRSGKPKSGVAVNLYSGGFPSRKFLETRYTDKEGIVKITQRDSVESYFIKEKKDDCYPSSSSISFYPERYIGDHYPYWVELKSDRGVYRPGQTVRFWGVAYLPELRDLKRQPQVVPNAKVEILLDKDSEQIETKEFLTDEFGSFYGEFVLPSDADGYYSIRSKYHGMVNFQVAQYKRPTFQIELDPVKSIYSFGSPVALTGKVLTYSGVAVPNVKVNYNIVRAFDFFRLRYRHHGSQVDQGELKTDSEGNFTLRFTPRREKSLKKQALADRYEVNITVTSEAGETQNVSTSILVGESPLDMKMYIGQHSYALLPQNIEKSDTSYIKFSAFNMMQVPQTVPCKVTLSSLKDDRDIYKEKPLDSLAVVKQVFERNITSGDSISISEWRDLPSGAYRLLFETEGNNKAKKEWSFVLFAENDKRIPVRSLFWLPKNKIDCKEGETAVVLFGSSEKDLYVLAELFDADKLLSRRWIKISKENYRYELPYKADYGNSLLLSLTYARNGQGYNRQVAVNREMPNQQLSIKTVTFRDYLLPGADEKWTFSIVDRLGNPVEARFIADMYDASLNAIRKNRWDIFFNKYDYSNYIRYMFSNREYYDSLHRYHWMYFPTLTFDNFSYLRDSELYDSGLVAFSKQKSRASVQNVVQEDLAAPMNDMVMGVAEAEAAAGGGVEDADYRNNFNETAFFYPNLQTDSSGNVSFSFRIPESNTLWQFQAVAYTKDLQHGKIERNVTTSKPLMVSPNMPRFVRQGDEVYISAVIQNNSDEPDSGNVSFELFNPYNDSIVESGNESFSLNARATGACRFTFNVSEAYSVLGIRIRAEGKKHADGEQHLIPVLPSRSMVTETLPFGLSGKGNKTITMSSLKNNRSKTLENYRLTLEYTVNPTWYVVQALPSILSSDANNALGLITSYYANTVSSGIANKNHRIENAIKIWKSQQKEMPVSELLKNEQLKTILISETPWVLEATNMTERMQQLENLFDENRIVQEQRTALNKLKFLQMPSGAWSWFKGMYPSTNVTMQVLEYMSRLASLGFVEYEESAKEMQIKALAYLDKEFLKDKKEERMYLPSFDVNYLYVRSAYRDIPLAGETLDRHKAMMDSLLKHWPRLGLGGKAKAAVAAFRYGFVKEAKMMIESLRQYATKTEQMGMFWDTSHSSAINQEGAIRTQTLIAQAFAEVEPESSEINEIKRWLLMQKQTQDWGNTVATADAVYTLLSSGDDWLTVDNDAISLLWGGKPVEVPADDPFTGYIQQSKDAGKISENDATVKINSSAAHPSWGALYWQYFEDFDKVKQSGSGLKLSKQLLVERMVDGKMKWLPVENQTIKTGDKVRVRIVLSADRDMEFVYLKNQRAACFEPTEQLSGYRYKNGIGYYQQNNDAVTNFYFDFVPKGTFEIEYDLWVDRSGTYHNGISTVQCLYAPQYAAQTPGETIVVE